MFDCWIAVRTNGKLGALVLVISGVPAVGTSAIRHLLPYNPYKASKIKVTLQLQPLFSKTGKNHSDTSIFWDEIRKMREQILEVEQRLSKMEDILKNTLRDFKDLKAKNNNLSKKAVDVEDRTRGW